jgi:hypothetical protein
MDWMYREKSIVIIENHGIGFPSLSRMIHGCLSSMYCHLTFSSGGKDSNGSDCGWGCGCGWGLLILKTSSLYIFDFHGSGYRGVAVGYKLTCILSENQIKTIL